MAWPHIFGALSGNQPASFLDDNFNAAAFASDITTLSAEIAALPSSATPLIPVAGGSPGADVVLSRDDHQHPPQSAAPNLQIGTSYTIAASDDGGVVDLSNASAITVTLPNSLAIGFSCLCTQSGAGQVTFSAASGAHIRQGSSFTKTRTQWSEVSMHVRTNGGSNTAEWVLSGDMA